MSDFERMIEEVAAGGHPLLVVEAMITGDRVDDITSDAAKAAAFQQIAGQIQDYKGYVGPDWITAIADQIRGGNPTAVGELTVMAQQNREQFAGQARIEGENADWNLWDNVYRGLLALATDQLPPPPPPLS
jgi:hypothetical protein